MRFKGTLGTSGTITALPASHEAGDTYRVITAGTYAGKYCEVGTLIICVNDGTAAADADWTSVETNEDGAVVGPSSSTENSLAVFSTASGRVIKDAGSYVTYLNHVAAAKTGYIDGLKITGSGYGEAANLSSGTAGVMSYGDAGPQIRFTSGSQNGAMIFNHYDSVSGTTMGASFNFLTDQSNGAAVKANGILGTTRAAFGQNSFNNSYTLYVNGNSYFNGTVTTSKGNGYFLTDGSGTAYAGVYDNQTNLWIGATSSTGSYLYFYRFWQ